jgi:hypothetical protein
MPLAIFRKSLVPFIINPSGSGLSLGMMQRPPSGTHEAEKNPAQIPKSSLSSSEIPENGMRYTFLTGKL